MKSSISWKEYQELELIASNQPQTKWQRLQARFHQMWLQAIARLESSSEPNVWRTHDEVGAITWNAYDPITGKAIYQVSASEVRAWLEERHYPNRFNPDQDTEWLRVKHLGNLI